MQKDLSSSEKVAHKHKKNEKETFVNMTICTAIKNRRILPPEASRHRIISHINSKH